MVLVYTMLSSLNSLYSPFSSCPERVLTVAEHLRVTLVPELTSFVGSMFRVMAWILNSGESDLPKLIRAHLSKHIPPKVLNFKSFLFL